MKVGIVGSRRRIDKENIYKLVDSLKKEDIVVSGGCKGVDSWAEERAKERGLNTIIFKPKLDGCNEYWKYVQAYYSRNKQIAEESDVIYAFVSSDRTGGTENTIKYASGLKKKVVIL